MHHDFTNWTHYNQPEVISVYDAHHREQTRGSTLLTTNKPYPASKDVEASEAYDGAKNTYDFYLSVHWDSKSSDVHTSIINYSWKTGKRLITLTDQQAILIRDDGFKIISP